MLNTSDSQDWLLTRLDAYAAMWPVEPMTLKMREFVCRQPRCFESTCFDDGHVTGSAWVVCQTRTHVLLTHHAKLDKWLQLGGHSDGDPNTLRVAMREAEEESGLAVETISESIFDIDIHVIPARGAEPAHKHYDVRFLLEADASDRLTIVDESHDLRWIMLEDLPSLTMEESMLRMRRKIETLSAGR